MQKKLQGYFITGSDTGVGKTWVARQLIQQLLSSHPSIKVRKPVESGCTLLEGVRFPADGAALYQANQSRETLDIVTPYRFLAALAPDRAARMEQHTLTLQQLLQACLHQVQPGDLLVVEGAGGFYSPICDDGLNADLARELGLKVIIVCKDRLGAINQALLTINAVKTEGLEVQAVVLNRCQPLSDEGLQNDIDLKKRTDVPVFTCGYQATLSGTVVQSD
jgi:dethiobiotin synthetase